MDEETKEQAENMAMDLIEGAFKAGIIQDLIVSVNIEGGKVVGGSCKADESKRTEENKPPSKSGGEG